MKSCLNKCLLTGIIVGGLLSPIIVQADETTDNTAALQSLTSAISASMPPGDMTRKDLATALINYEANARIQEYMLNRELLFMGAPGIVYAVQAGSAIGGYVAPAQFGGTAYNATALGLANQSMAYALHIFTVSPTISIDGSQITVTNLPTNDPTTFYANSNVASFVTGGDMSSILGLNPASVMKRNNLSTGNISPAQTQMMINTLSSGFPTIPPGAPPSLATDIQNVKTVPLTGIDQEAIVNSLQQAAINGLTASAFADIVARRTPSGQNQPSMMDVMDQYSSQRFTNPDWIKGIAASSDAALLREITHMMAFNTWMQFQQYKLLEQQMALMASLNAQMSKVIVSLNAVNAQIAAAAAQAAASSNQLQQQMQKQTTTPPGG